MDDTPSARPTELTPTQRRVLEELMAAGRSRPSFRESLADDLRGALETGLAGLVPHLPAEGLRVRKADLAQVHACETHHLAETGVPFDWHARNARGVVAHKAIELSVSLDPSPPAVELVDLALERLVEDDWEWGPGRWLSEAPAVELAELRTFAADVVHKFQDEFPPLKRSWRPRLESSLAAVLCDGLVTLRGKVDLALGQAQGTEARVMIVDFKTGQPAATHVDDLRYYAVLETLRVGVPPFRVASWYLDAGHWHHEDVDEDVLFAAVRRIVDGVVKLVELQVDRRPPQVSPGPACGYCVLRAECSGALAWSEQRAEVGLA
ncbi:MAG TPA: PD-(D/E)XK nuclease family protein [Acidimicrobiales bacterium]|nr:PD-(D/E)XK nuclease family protein [Acidimicrobiales bacterium]